MTTPDVKQETPMAEEVNRYTFIMTHGFEPDGRIYKVQPIQPHKEVPLSGGNRFVLASDYDAAVARAEKAEKEIEALRNLANNLKPGPISEALVGERYTRESALTARVAALETGIRKWASECAECSGKGRVLSPLNQSARNPAKPDELVRVHQFVPCEACADIRAYLPKEPT